MFRVALILLMAGSARAAQYLGHSGYWVEVVATGYSPHDRGDSHHWSTKDHVTADMTDWRRFPYGVASGDLRRLGYHHQVIIPRGVGYCKTRADRVFEVDDTGGRIKAMSRRTGIVHIDLRFKTEASARAFGKRKIRVFVIAETERIR
jgi:3D (Asp-Asp-Asp) domain-containing protein